MNCGEVVVRLSADIDGELAESESIDVRRHLLSCVECERKRALLEQTSLAFRAVARIRARTGYLRSFAVSALLTLVVAIGVRAVRSSLPSATHANVRQLIGIDCGTPGSTDCVVEQPCGDDGQCSADPLVPGLR